MLTISCIVLLVVYICVFSFIYLSYKQDKEDRERKHKETLNKYLKWKAHIFNWVNTQSMDTTNKELYLIDSFYDFLVRNKIPFEYYSDLEKDFNGLIRDWRMVYE